MIKPKKRYATINQICEHYPFKPGTLYQWCRKDGLPGFREKCVKKIGRMVLIDIDAFEKFIEEGTNEE